jgi:hypothetical protein
MNLPRLFLASAALLLCQTTAHAFEFKSINECVVGAKVKNRKDQTGKIVSVSNGMCKVALDGTSEQASYLFWMLKPADGGSTGSADKLVNGTYKCYSLTGGTLNYMFMDVQITGSGTYQDKQGSGGKYRLEGSKIIFEGGPFAKANAALLSGPKIGMNMNGGNFFNTTCSLAK